MLKLVPLFACFAGYVFLHKRCWRIPYMAAPASSLGMLIGLLFLADFVGMLEPAAYVLHAIGIGAFLFYLYEEWRGRFVNFKQDVWAPAAALGLIFLGLFQLNYAGSFHEWDEFSHWGSIIKVIYGANTFHFDVNPLYFQDYPPGTALFSYFVLKLLGYSEGAAYFSYSLILFAFSLPVLGLAARRGWAWVLAYGALIIVLVSRLGHGWSNVLIDHVLSVIFGGAIASYFLLREEKAPVWPVSLMLVALVLAKHAGQSLALMAVALCALDALVRETIHNDAPYLRRPTVTRLLQIAFFSALLFAPAALMGWTWKRYVIEAGFMEGYGRHSLAALIAKSVECCSSSRDVAIASHFVDLWLGVRIQDAAMTGGMVSIVFSRLGDRLLDIAAVRGFSPVLLFIGLTSASLAAAFFASGAKEKARLAVASLTLSAGAIAFSFSLLLFYLYAIAEYEAVSLDSFGRSFRRFHKIYYLGWALAVMAIIAAAMARGFAERRRNGKFAAAALVVLTVALISPWSKAARQLRAGASTMTEQRAAIREWVLPQLAVIPYSEPVYIVWQGSNGFEFWMIHHEALPRRTNLDCYSLGAPHFKGDVWSCPMSEKEVARAWANFKYLAVAHGLADLKATYPSLLATVPSNLERGLFRIEKQDEGLLFTLVSHGE